MQSLVSASRVKRRNASSVAVFFGDYLLRESVASGGDIDHAQQKQNLLDLELFHWYDISVKRNWLEDSGSQQPLVKTWYYPIKAKIEQRLLVLVL